MGQFAVRIISLLSKLPLVSIPFSMAELLIRLLCDTEAKAEAAYLFGETADNERSVLDRGIELYRSGRVLYLALPGFEARSGYPGFSKWKAELQAQNIPESVIINVPWKDRKEFSTRTEAIDLVTFASQRGWQSLIIVGAPFHVPRCFLSVLGQTIKQVVNLRLYSEPGASLSWTQVVVHSQGISKGKRAQLITREMIGIFAYVLKGDLPRPKTALRYLNSRDA